MASSVTPWSPAPLASPLPQGEGIVPKVVSDDEDFAVVEVEPALTSSFRSEEQAAASRASARTGTRQRRRCFNESPRGQLGGGCIPYSKAEIAPLAARWCNDV